MTYIVKICKEGGVRDVCQITGMEKDGGTAERLCQRLQTENPGFVYQSMDLDQMLKQAQRWRAFMLMGASSTEERIFDQCVAAHEEETETESDPVKLMQAAEVVMDTYIASRKGRGLTT